jgi:hypothetical protein
MKSIEYKNRQVRIQKIIRELEKALDDLVLEILKKRTENKGERLKGGKRKNSS